jgi:hypothetical protein
MHNTMSASSPHKTYLRALSFLSVFGVALAVQGQSVTWQALPFPTDSNWGGPEGQLASITSNQVVLDGQPARSEQTFTGPAIYNMDVSLDARNTSDGALWLFFIPLGQPATVASFTNSIFFQLGFSNGGQDITGIFHRHSPAPDTAIWSTAYPIAAQTNYHVTLAVDGSGALSVSINGQSFPLPSTAIVPFSQYQIEIFGWQPNAIWHVSNFAVSTPPTCPDLVGTWSGQMNVVQMGKGYSTTPLSIQVTDQSTNGCLVRGYLTQGSLSNSFPNIRFGWNPWFRIPFTGAIPDGTTLLLNIGGDGSGKASAILNMSETPPVLTKFVYQPNNGNTLTGDLTLQPSKPQATVGLRGR